MSPFFHTVGWSVALLLITSPSLALAKKTKKDAVKKGILGVRIKQSGSQVVAASVPKYWGAWHAGVQKDDVIISVDGQSVTDKQQAGELMSGPACEYVTLGLDRDGEKLEKRVLRLSRRTPGDCLGYYTFKTTVQRKLKKVGRDLFKVVMEQGTEALLKLEGNTQAQKSPKAYLSAVQRQYGVDISTLFEHVYQVQDWLKENMPEGKNGTWEPYLTEVRVQHKKMRHDSHVDRDKVIVLTTLIGKPTRYHPLGCLASNKDYKEYRNAPFNSAIVISGVERFQTWDFKRPEERRRFKAPEAVKTIASICKLKEAGFDYTYNGVPHSRPENLKKRVVLILGFEFKPNKGV